MRRHAAARCGVTLLMRGGDADALRGIVRQSELSGAARRAAMLHVDRLPPALARPHHLRLARQAIQALAQADRAQLFELSRGRVAIIWRGRAEEELERTRDTLAHLLSDQPTGEAPDLGELLTLYDLPDQAAWLLDEIAEPVIALRRPPGGAPLDLRLLARLESGLAQADLSLFARRRPVMALPPPSPAASQGSRAPIPAWEERYFAVDELARTLCPDHQLRADPWLFRRLTRALDIRLLAMLAARGELSGSETFAINLNVATLLSRDFLRLDQSLPAALRGEVILILRAADILSDAAAFAFARNFAHARAYRLALAGATVALLRFLDVVAAGLDIVQIALDAELREAPGRLHAVVGARTSVVVTGLDRPSDLRWAEAAGFRLGRGRVFSP